MSSHLFMGAINKVSNERENPKFADKKNNYKCPSCERDVIFKKGQIKIPHFAHKASEIKCAFYDKPSETEIHKEAKILMKSLLDNKKELHFSRKCSDCNKHKIIDINYDNNDKAIIEYKFKYNDSNRSADVALINTNNDIKFIFEICHKNPTKECNRPEPWVEINATELIKKINEDNDYNIECIREYRCEECVEKNNIEKEILKAKELNLQKQKEIELQQFKEFEYKLQIIKQKLKLEEENIHKLKLDKNNEIFELELNIKKETNEIDEIVKKYYDNIFELKDKSFELNKEIIKINSNIVFLNETNNCYYCLKYRFNDFFICINHNTCNLLNEINNSYICVKCNNVAIKIDKTKNYNRKNCYCNFGCDKCIKGKPIDNKKSYKCYFYIKCFNCDNSYSYDYIFDNRINDNSLIIKLNDKWNNYIKDNENNIKNDVEINKNIIKSIYENNKKLNDDKEKNKGILEILYEQMENIKIEINNIHIKINTTNNNKEKLYDSKKQHIENKYNILINNSKYKQLEKEYGELYKNIYNNDYYNKSIQKCFKCNKLGHYSRDCYKQKRKIVDKCFKCGEEDHYIKECPKNILKVNPDKVDFID
jgi:hypothetical protein